MTHSHLADPGRRSLMLAAGDATLAIALPDTAQADEDSKMTKTPIRIGFCTDLSGPYESVDGQGGADAIRMAIADMGGNAAGRPVELVLGDHRNDVAEAGAITRRWCGDDGVDMIVSGVNSDTSLAITAVAAARGTPVLVVGAGTSVQTCKRAAPSIIQYAYSTVALATVPGIVLTRNGKERWFYVTADYPFGRELEAHGRDAVEAAGGTVVGSVINPHGEEDFTPFLKNAAESGADVLGLANGHAELLHAMAAMDDMELSDRFSLVGLLTFIDDLHRMGLEKAQGLYFADSWFWTRDAASREWAQRFYAKRGRMPSSLQAADYSAALQYLKAADAVGSAAPNAVLRHLRAASLDDMYVTSGRIREDGTMLHDMYLLQAKSPAESQSAWDLCNLVDTVSGSDAFPADATP